MTYAKKNALTSLVIWLVLPFSLYLQYTGHMLIGMGIMLVLITAASLFLHEFRLTLPLLGGALNFTAAFVNGGKMPVVAPVPPCYNDATHFCSSSPHFRYLCDIIPLGGMSRASIGDILAVAGILWLMFGRKNGNRESRG